MRFDNLVQAEPGFIIGPISTILGFIIEYIYRMVSALTISNSLGISIIFFTIVVRTLMLPLAFKQQKSMMAMQRMAPEIEKIKKKYAGRDDKDSQQKMNVEMQKFYSENKINPLGGCLPIFIQMPIFLSLNFIMMNSHQFVAKIGELYNNLASTIINHGTTIGTEAYMAIIHPLVHPKLPSGMVLDMGMPQDLARALNRFNVYDWAALRYHLPADTLAYLDVLLLQKDQIEHFFGIDLVNRVTFVFPGLFIPILAALTTFLSSYIMMQMQTQSGPNAKVQQTMMLVAMPAVMAVTTFSLPAGVGLYWITSSIYQVFQQMFLNKQGIGRGKAPQ